MDKVNLYQSSTEIIAVKVHSEYARTRYCGLDIGLMTGVRPEYIYLSWRTVETAYESLHVPPFGSLLLRNFVYILHDRAAK